MYIVLVLILQSKKKNSQILLKRAKISVIPIVLNGVLSHICAILLVYYRSPCMNQIQEKYYLYRVGKDRSPNASGNFGWRVRCTLYSLVWRVTVLRQVGT
jgi:hypothetical protein